MSDLDALRERLVPPVCDDPTVIIPARSFERGVEAGVDAALAALEQVGWWSNRHKQIFGRLWVIDPSAPKDADDAIALYTIITPDTEGEGR